jgi:hypothetical protein
MRPAHILRRTDELAACESRLRRAGLPLLIEKYSAYEDIFTRAVPRPDPLRWRVETNKTRAIRGERSSP